MAKDAEVHQYPKGSSASIGKVPSQFGGRNRIRGGAADTGQDRGGPVKGAHQKGALAGTYSPDKIATTGGIQIQNQLRGSGKNPEAGREPFDPTIKTQREMLPHGMADPKGGPGSMKQGPEGDFGGLPGQTGTKRSDV